MAGNTRGKIKEHLEGCHRNFDWSNAHMDKLVVLIDEHNPKLTEAIKALQTAVGVLDEQLMKVYAVI